MRTRFGYVRLESLTYPLSPFPPHRLDRGRPQASCAWGTNTTCATRARPGRLWCVSGRFAGCALLATIRGLDRLLRRLVGEENDILRYFLWAVLPSLLVGAVWAGIYYGLTPSPPSPAPWKLQSIAVQTIEAGNPLTVTTTVLRPIPDARG